MIRTIRFTITSPLSINEACNRLLTRIDTGETGDEDNALLTDLTETTAPDDNELEEPVYAGYIGEDGTVALKPLQPARSFYPVFRGALSEAVGGGAQLQLECKPGGVVLLLVALYAVLLIPILVGVPAIITQQTGDETLGYTAAGLLGAALLVWLFTKRSRLHDRVVEHRAYLEGLLEARLPG